MDGHPQLERLRGHGMECIETPSLRDQLTEDEEVGRTDVEAAVELRVGEVLVDGRLTIPACGWCVADTGAIRRHPHDALDQPIRGWTCQIRNGFPDQLHRDGLMHQASLKKTLLGFRVRGRETVAQAGGQRDLRVERQRGLHRRPPPEPNEGFQGLSGYGGSVAGPEDVVGMLQAPSGNGRQFAEAVGIKGVNHALCQNRSGIRICGILSGGLQVCP